MPNPNGFFSLPSKRRVLWIVAVGTLGPVFLVLLAGAVFMWWYKRTYTFEMAGWTITPRLSITDPLAVQIRANGFAFDMSDTERLLARYDDSFLVYDDDAGVTYEFHRPLKVDLTINAGELLPSSLEAELGTTPISEGGRRDVIGVADRQGYKIFTFLRTNAILADNEAMSVREDYIIRDDLTLVIFTSGKGDLFEGLPPPMIERLQYQ